MLSGLPSGLAGIVGVYLLGGKFKLKSKREKEQKYADYFQNNDFRYESETFLRIFYQRLDCDLDGVGSFNTLFP